MNIYLDNATTSFPKPNTVPKTVFKILSETASSSGRGGAGKSRIADRILFKARENIKNFFNVPYSKNVIFTYNATTALNIALSGTLKEGDHVLTSRFEHNSVTRPLANLSKKGVTISAVQVEEGTIAPKDVETLITSKTRMIAVTHASNVIGTISPIHKIGNIARKHKILFLVDAAQSAGNIAIDMEENNIDILVCAGHKSLLGPQGVGLLCIGKGIKIEPLIFGGTGSSSESEKMPKEYPDCLEAGTNNTPAIAGLSAGIDFIKKEGIETIRKKELLLTEKTLNGLSKISRVKLYGNMDPAKRISVISFNISGLDPSTTGNILEEKYGIITRVGLHCSPSTHKTVGTFPEGTVRVSIGYFNTDDDIDNFLIAVKEISEKV